MFDDDRCVVMLTYKLVTKDNQSINHEVTTYNSDQWFTEKLE